MFIRSARNHWNQYDLAPEQGCMEHGSTWVIWHLPELADDNVWTPKMADDKANNRRQAQNGNGIFVSLSVQISNHYKKSYL